MSKFQALLSTDNGHHQVQAQAQATEDTSLQPLAYYSDDNDATTRLHSIESYNKNDANQLLNLPTPVYAHAHSTQSSSPIPVLLRSASSLLSRSMSLPPGSLRASTLTVITGMVGGGTFTFSYGVYKAGTIPALCYLIVIAMSAAYSTHTIVFCAEQNNCPSFRALAKKLYGAKTAIFIQVCVLLILWMVCISYMTLTKNLLSTAVTHLTSGNDGSGTHWYDNDILLLLVACIVPTILALQRKVSALRYASLFGLTVILFSTVLVILTYFRWCSNTSSDAATDDASSGRTCIAQSLSNRDTWMNMHFLDHTYTIALFFGGFAAQFTVLPIYFEMQRRSPRNMNKCITSGFSFTLFIYICIAYFGYWTFPHLVDAKLDQNLITLYHNDVAMLVAQLLLALYVMSIIPLFAHAFRKSIKEMLLSRKHAHKMMKLIADEDEEEHVDDAEIIEDAIENAHFAYVPVTPNAKQFVADTKRRRQRQQLQKPPQNGAMNVNEMELPVLSHALITIAFLASVFAVSLFADNIGQVNSIVASTMLPVCCFIFPCMCAFKTARASFRMKLISVLTSMFSVFNAVMFFYTLLFKT